MRGQVSSRESAAGPKTEVSKRKPALLGERDMPKTRSARRFALDLVQAHERFESKNTCFR